MFSLVSLSLRSVMASSSSSSVTSATDSTALVSSALVACWWLQVPLWWPSRTSRRSATTMAPFWTVRLSWTGQAPGSPGIHCTLRERVFKDSFHSQITTPYLYTHFFTQLSVKCTHCQHHLGLSCIWKGTTSHWLYQLLCDVFKHNS